MEIAYPVAPVQLAVLADLGRYAVALPVIETTTDWLYSPEPVSVFAGQAVASTALDFRDDLGTRCAVLAEPLAVRADLGSYAVMLPAVETTTAWIYNPGPVSVFAAQAVASPALDFREDLGTRCAVLAESLAVRADLGSYAVTLPTVETTMAWIYNPGPISVFAGLSVASTPLDVRDDLGSYLVALPAIETTTAWIYNPGPISVFAGQAVASTPLAFLDNPGSYALPVGGQCADPAPVAPETPIIISGTVTTYFLRGLDSQGHYVSWSSTGSPDLSPAQTIPASIGTLTAICVVGVTQTAAHYALLTTAKTLLVDNRMLLPVAPCGDVLLSDMQVYADNAVVTDYDEVSVSAIDGQFYACLNEPNQVEGRGVVSYLIKAPS